MTNPVSRLALIVIGLAIYLGLAGLGWGGFAAFFAHPALIAIAAVQTGLSLFACFAGGNLSPGVREDRGNRWVLPVFGAIGLLQAWLPARTDRHEIACLDGGTLRWIGVALSAAGGMLRLWPVVILGNRFSGLVAIQPDHALVTTGIYSTIRNPSYLGLLTNALGWSLAFRSAAGVILTILLIPPLAARMTAEERLLHDHFGPEYDAYRARTWRLIPGVY